VAAPLCCWVLDSGVWGLSHSHTHTLTHSHTHTLTHSHTHTLTDCEGRCAALRPSQSAIAQRPLQHRSATITIRDCADCYGRCAALLWARNVKRFRGGLVCKAHRLLCHSTLGLIQKKRGVFPVVDCADFDGRCAALLLRVAKL